MQPDVSSFFDERSNTWTHLLKDPNSSSVAVIDPVWEFDPASGCLGNASPDVQDHLRKHHLKLEWVLETHIHADHLSAAQPLAKTWGAAVGTGARVAQVQRTFAPRCRAEPGFQVDGSQFDQLFTEGDEIVIGGLRGHVMCTPGHTPGCVTYVFGDAAFPGDTLFMPDYGTARADFPGGDSRTLYRSIMRILALPPSTRLFLCHDYGTADRRNYVAQTTVAQEKAANVHLAGACEESFVAMRNGRDRKLSMPALLPAAVNFNMRAGCMPPGGLASTLAPGP